MPESAPRLALASLLFALAAAPAQGQMSPDSLGWRFTAAAGYVQTSGNTQLSTVNLSDRITYRPSTRWQLQQVASWVYGYNDSAETANQILAGLRGDYYLSDHLSLYGQLGYERNTFAGIDSRYEEALGVSWGVIAEGKHRLHLEAGVSENQQHAPGAPVDGFWASRIAAKYRYNLTDKAYFEENAELLSNLEDTEDERFNSTTALVAPLTRSLSVRLGYLVRFDNQPVAGFKKTDTTFTSGIQVSF